MKDYRPIYSAFVTPEIVDISLVDLLTRDESSKVLQAEPSISRGEIFKLISNFSMFRLPHLGLNLGQADPRMRILELRGLSKEAPSEEYPSYRINSWDKILFSDTGQLMQNTDHTNNIFVYHGTQEEALREFIEAGYKVLPQDYQSRDYEKYSKRLVKAQREFEDKIRKK